MSGTPFFPRQIALSESMNWKLWSGSYAAGSYLVHHDAEYFAVRYAAGLLDVSPLFKYRVRGPDAAHFLARIMAKDVSRLAVGHVAYVCWCDERGKVIDDGTVMRRGEADFFVTSADPAYSWFSRYLRGFQVTVDDVTGRVAALALQGPKSRDVLREIAAGEVDSLRFFRTIQASVGGAPVWISRTGYTGDLGYELWMDRTDALLVWDAAVEAGLNHALRPIGLDALDVCRVEAGFILKNVDYYNALHALVESRTSSPYELALGWTVDLERKPFSGQDALRREKDRGSSWAFVGLEVNWNETERLYLRCGLPPQLPRKAWRTSVPVYRDAGGAVQIGYATSGTWSPVLKKNIALATIRAGHSIPGSNVYIEATVEHVRHRVSATVCKARFFNPQRKTWTPPCAT